MQRPRHRLIMGKNCIQELLKAAPERLAAVYTSHDPDPFIETLKRAGVPIHFVSKRDLKAMVDSESHQSFVAAVHERKSRTLKEFINMAPERSVVLALDALEDPQNLGSILRAAECFGVDAVVFSKNRGTDITPVVSKASVGGSELVEIFKVSNLAEGLRQLQEGGYTVLAADAAPNARSVYTYDFPEKVVIVLGSEGKGIQKLILSLADAILMIPMKGQIDSLNVSQAAAVFLSFSCQAGHSDI